MSADATVVDVPAADVPVADVPVDVPDVPVDVPVADVSDESDLPPPLLSPEAVRSLLRKAAAVADFDQPLISRDVASSILARGAARRRPAVDVNPPSFDTNDESSVPASVLSRGPFDVCRPDSATLGSFLVFDFHKLTRRVVVEDSATFEMYRECYYSDKRGPFPAKTVFLPGGPMSVPVIRLDPNVPPAKFPLQA